jgi:hypothetical protein
MWFPGVIKVTTKKCTANASHRPNRKAFLRGRRAVRPILLDRSLNPKSDPGRDEWLPSPLSIGTEFGLWQAPVLG